MGSEGFVVVAIGLVIGFFGVILFLKTKWGKKIKMGSRKRKKIKMGSRKRDKVLNDPDLLVKKLEERGKFVDDGKGMKYSVVEEDGKKKVKLVEEDGKKKVKLVEEKVQKKKSS